MKFELVKTNIVNVHADAIVLPANTGLKEGSGTSSAIFEAAGRKELTQACENLGSCEVGSAVPTLAYNLDAKYIIHAVVPKWIDGENGEYALLSSAYLTALKIADVMGCDSIAFPLLASGNNGFDLVLAFHIARESIDSFDGINLKKVFLVLFGNHITDIVKELGYSVIDIPEELQKKQNKKKHKSKKIADEGKEVARAFLDDQIQKGIEFLKVKKNREKVLARGIEIAAMAIRIIKKINNQMN